MRRSAPHDAHARDDARNELGALLLMMMPLAAFTASGCSFRVAAVPGAAALDLAAGTPTIDLSSAGPDLAVGMQPAPDLSVQPAPLDMSSGAHIMVSSVNTTGPIDLTALGTSDWVHWGFAKVDDVDRKASGNGQIGAVTVTGTGAVLKQFTGFPTQYSWSDGTTDGGGHPSAMNNVGGVYTNAGGLRVSVPAGKASRKLTVYLSFVNATARMQMALSDGSTAGHDDSGYTSSDGQIHDVAYMVDYSAASDGQQLNITWSLATPNTITPGAPAVALCALVLGPPAAPTP